jgi:hypothetical protein
MAEVQTSAESGETAQRFVEFVMMHSQQAAFALGLIAHPETGRPEVNPEVAHLFIEQLVMIRAKTRGNLSDEEQGILNNAISQLQMAFFEVVEGGVAEADGGEVEAGAGAAEVPSAQPEPPAASGEKAPETGDDESTRKRFTKSYGS